MKKNILITGASSGIGAATARYLSEQEYTTVLVARNEERLQKFAEEIGDSCYICPFDLTQLEGIESIFEFCREKEILLNGMVHCAGETVTSAIKANEIDTMERILKINCEAFVELGKYFINRKYSEKGASVVAVSSFSAQSRRRGTSVYSASKAALEAVVEVMAKEAIGREIRVNSVRPAYVNTKMIDFLIGMTDFNAEQKLGVIEPEYIAYLIEFLLSDKGKYITGAHIPVSAGKWN